MEILNNESIILTYILQSYHDELRQEYQVKISNRFEVLESLDENVATEEETDIDKEWCLGDLCMCSENVNLLIF